MKELNRTVSGIEVWLHSGNHYMATRFLAVESLETFSVFFINTKTEHIGGQVDRLSFKVAQNLMREFNTLYKGKPW